MRYNPHGVVFVAMVKEGGNESVKTDTCRHKQRHQQHLERMWGVMDTVDAEAEVQGEAGCSGGEQSQLQALAGGLRRAGLAHKAVRPQLLQEDMAAFFF